MPARVIGAAGEAPAPGAGAGGAGPAEAAGRKRWVPPQVAAEAAMSAEEREAVKKRDTERRQRDGQKGRVLGYTSTEFLDVEEEEQDGGEGFGDGPTGVAVHASRSGGAASNKAGRGKPALGSRPATSSALAPGAPAAVASAAAVHALTANGRKGAGAGGRVPERYNLFYTGSNGSAQAGGATAGSASSSAAGADNGSEGGLTAEELKGLYDSLAAQEMVNPELQEREEYRAPS
jgi:hypothetical protein